MEVFFWLVLSYLWLILTVNAILMIVMLVLFIKRNKERKQRSEYFEQRRKEVEDLYDAQIEKLDISSESKDEVRRRMGIHRKD